MYASNGREFEHPSSNWQNLSTERYLGKDAVLCGSAACKPLVVRFQRQSTNRFSFNAALRLPSGLTDFHDYENSDQLDFKNESLSYKSRSNRT